MKSSIWDNSGKNIFKFIPGWESQPRRLEILNGRLLLETMAATGKFATLTPGFALLMGHVTTSEFHRSGNRVPFLTDSFSTRAKDTMTVSQMSVSCIYIYIYANARLFICCYIIFIFCLWTVVGGLI
jgi:hypothetical protein